jgi:hypothetical protein
VASGANRSLTIGAAAGSLTLLIAAVLMLWPSDPTDYTFTPGREQSDGETVGWVSKVEANTIHVNSGPFGSGVVPLVVTKGTRIVVGTKEGWFEDIRPGGQVKVAYEFHQGRRFARSVELLVDEGTRRSVRSPLQLKSTVGGQPPVPPTPAIARPAAPPVEVRPALRPEAGAPIPSAPRAQPSEIAAPPARPPTLTPARSVSAPEGVPRAVEPGRAAEGPRPPVPAAPRPTESTRSAESGEASDGSAAVDWLLKERR